MASVSNEKLSMNGTNDQVDVGAMRASIAQQAQHVKSLKLDGAAKHIVMEEVAKLKMLREELAKLDVADVVPRLDVNKRALDDALIRRMFVVSAFEIYRGVAGLFDLGPPGTGVKDNLLSLWKRHFVLEENMLQVECTTLTPEVVLKTSGHVDKFADLMVKDLKSGECFRADKLLEDHIDDMFEQDKKAGYPMSDDRRKELATIQRKADSYSPVELQALFVELQIVSPTTGSELSDPFPFNLMFATSIGPSGDHPGFLRPETAQGIFVNFKRLLEYNNGRMPFAAAQIGLAYRNEIAPRNGLLRVREFTMAEIEHFVKPEEKDHHKFERVADVKMTLFPRENQLGTGYTTEKTIGEAVQDGIVANETLGYFMARTQLFLLKAGIRPEGLRFRQHLSTEMAHYACDCWDAEILLASGWVECVGHADRACYDLSVHAKASKVDMHASHKYANPVTKEVIELKPNKRELGKAFKRDNKVVLDALTELAEDATAAMAFENKLASDGSAELVTSSGTFSVVRSMVSFERVSKVFHDEKYVPSVVEPSFGVGRIMEAIFQHTFKIRPEDEQRTYFSFPPAIAPTKVAMLPLDNRIEKKYLMDISQELTNFGISNVTEDSNAAIGRRYARMDEIGVPFAVTVDFDTPNTNLVTVRERDSTQQVYVSVDEVVDLLRRLSHEYISWEDVWVNETKYPHVARDETETDN